MAWEDSPTWTEEDYWNSQGG